MKTQDKRRQQIFRAIMEANRIELDVDFNKSIKIINQLPVLTQYVKLANIIEGWFDDVITKDKSVQPLKDTFVEEASTNLDLYVEGHSIKGLVKINEDMKNTLKHLFVK